MARPDLVQSESIGSLVRGIFMDLRMLVHEEIALARVERREQAGRARAAAVSLGLAAAALATAMADLLGWPVSAGFLALAVLLGLVGLAALMIGRTQLRRVRAVPTETVSTLKENVEWIAKRLSSGQR